MAVADEIETRLRAAFAPTSLTVEDQSERHRGHAGWREGGETHFHVAIAAPAFGDMSRLDRHRAIHAALGPDLVGRIHALSLDVS
jgi:BolA protein